MESADGLECDDDMSDAGHRVYGLSISREVVVFPEDICFICLGGRVEGRGIYVRVGSGADDPAHGTPWLWSEGHEGATETSQLCFLLLITPSPICIVYPPSAQTMSEIGNGLRSKQEIQSLFDTLRSQLDNFQDTREKLVKVNTQLPLNENPDRSSHSFPLLSL